MMSLMKRNTGGGGGEGSTFYTFSLFFLFLTVLLTFMILYLTLLIAELFEAISPEMKALRGSGFLRREGGMVLFFIDVEKNFSR